MVRQAVGHPRRHGLESGVAGILVHPHDEMAQMVEALESPRQTDRLAEVPAVAQDYEGRPFVQEPPVSSEEILQAASDPSSSSPGSEVSRGRPGRTQVTPPPQEA